MPSKNTTVHDGSSTTTLTMPGTKTIKTRAAVKLPVVQNILQTDEFKVPDVPNPSYSTTNRTPYYVIELMKNSNWVFWRPDVTHNKYDPRHINYTKDFHKAIKFFDAESAAAVLHTLLEGSGRIVAV